MNTMIDSECVVKSAPRGAGHTIKLRNAGKVMKQLPEAVPGSRLDSEAFRAALRKRASTPLYIPNQPRHRGLNE